MKHPFDFSNDALASMSDQIGVLQTTTDELTAENAKLRAELAEAVGLLEGIGDFANMEVIDVGAYIQEGGLWSGDFDISQWQRIVEFLGKRGFYDTNA